MDGQHAQINSSPQRYARGRRQGVQGTQQALNTHRASALQTGCVQSLLINFAQKVTHNSLNKNWSASPKVPLNRESGRAPVSFPAPFQFKPIRFNSSFFVNGTGRMAITAWMCGCGVHASLPPSCWPLSLHTISSTYHLVC